MARILWKRLSPTDFNAMTGSAAVSLTGGGARHIALGRSIPGNDIEGFLPRRTLNQATVATEAGARWPRASLSFVSNRERRNGEWYIRNQKNNRHPAWARAAGFPSSYDAANPPVVLVLEIDGTYHVDWRDERTLAQVAPSIANRARGVDAAPPALVAELLLQPRLSPVDARVIDGQLQYVDSTKAHAASADDIVDTVRHAHLGTAARLAEYLAGSNAGPSFTARFEAVHELLRRTLTSERALQLAIHVRGLEGMMDAAAERLDEVTFVDIAIFAADLIDLLNQLPAYRRFVEEAGAAASADAEALNAAASVVSALENEPDEIVEPQLKLAIRQVRELAEERLDRLTTFALIRTAGNVFRAVGRFLNERAVVFSRDATKAFDDSAGKAFGKAIANLLRVAYAGAALTALQALFPGEFAFLAQLIRAATALIF